MIPYFLLGTPAHTALVNGLLIASTSLLITAILLLLVFTLRAEQRLYTLTLALALPSAGLCIALPFLMHSASLPLLQGFLLPPLLLFPLSLPIRTLQHNWIATAQELGANRHARLRFFWWPLLQKSFVFSLSLATFFSIVQ